jgi:hypothetical protein
MSSKNSKNGAKTPLRKCPVTHHTTDQEDFEHDFTTQGRIGSLECPFAQMNGLPDTPESQDPIAAEFHADQTSITSPTTASGAAGRCPIRFLDKHSPEEIAKYFENHKHELPRSHQVCVSRYQRNESQVKELDAKYGNMVNMIQGLGVKHKQYLPGSEIPVKQEAGSSVAVEKWAEGVSQSEGEWKAVNEDEVRASHFERPLREVRVGESPSRPWGISVPVAKEIPVSAMPSEAADHVSPSKTDLPPPPAGEQNIQGASQFQSRPLDHQKTSAQAPASQEAAATAPTSQTRPQIIFNGPTFFGYSPSTLPPLPQQIVFNGPVFFGYSSEESASFLQTLNSGKSQQKATP